MMERRLKSGPRVAARHRFAACLGLGLALGACVSGTTVETETARSLPPPSPVGEAVVGRTILHRVSAEDSLIELARTYDLGYVELAAANPDVDPWLPGAGGDLTIPAAHLLPPGPREGIVINLSEQRLYFFDGTGAVRTFPIGVGREGADTPLGQTTVVRKRKDPTWYPPASARAEDPSLPRAVPPGPENPLGGRALYLGWPAYLIHGTNEPYGIGRRVSRGCIRLYPEGIRRLYPLVAKGTAVRVIDRPVKVAAVSGAIFIEAHPSLAQASQLEADGRFDPEDDARARARLTALSGETGWAIDWLAVDRALAERRGFPVQVSGRPPTRRASPAPAPARSGGAGGDRTDPGVLANPRGDLTSLWSALKRTFGGTGAAE